MIKGPNKFEFSKGISVNKKKKKKKLNLNNFKGNKRKGSGFQHHQVQLVITSNGSDTTSASKAIVCKALQVSLFSSWAINFTV
ncbi:hypothetical protein V6N13_144202 [Hibiscus sabdariffa]|uniref:Uncharacterized protein n=1 Tax=Hibiscus sabdariffa TaxID=183260 RepID=A0ABR2FJZ1_9ROSI